MSIINSFVIFIFYQTDISTYLEYCGSFQTLFILMTKAYNSICSYYREKERRRSEEKEVRIKLEPPDGVLRIFIF